MASREEYKGKKDKVRLTQQEDELQIFTRNMARASLSALILLYY